MILAYWSFSNDWFMWNSVGRGCDLPSSLSQTASEYHSQTAQATLPDVQPPQKQGFGKALTKETNG